MLIAWVYTHSLKINFAESETDNEEPSDLKVNGSQDRGLVHLVASTLGDAACPYPIRNLEAVLWGQMTRREQLLVSYRPVKI
jgi:hypothetical protein